MMIRIQSWPQAKLTRWLAAIGLVHFLAWGWVALRFLPLNPDEIGIAAYSYNWATGQGLRYGLNDDIFAPEAYKWRECSFEVMRPVADAWVGIFLLVRRTPLFARLSSGVAAAIALYLFFLIGRRMLCPQLGIFCMLAALADPFWFLGSATVRSEMPLLAASAAVLALLLSWDGPWKEFAIGVIAGLQVGIHPNAIPVQMGIVAAYLLLKDPPPSWASFCRFSLGALAGVVLIFSCLNIERLLVATSWFLAPPHYPPISVWPWHPGQWFTNTMRNLVSGQTYYLPQGLMPAWPLVVKLYWSGVMACLIYGLRLYRQTPEARRTLRALGGALCITFLGMVFLVAHQDALYVLNYQAVLVPLLGYILFFAWRQPDAVSRVLRLLGSSLLMASLLISISSAIVTPQRYKSYSQIIEETQTLLQPMPHERVIGPLWLWYALPPQTFRDAGALVISRYYTGGRADVARWVRHWSPDVFVVDWGFRRTYMKNPLLPEPERLSQLLGRDLRYRGKIDAGYNYGTLSFYQILPPPQAPKH